MRKFYFQNHDGDDDGKHAIAERFEPGFIHKYNCGIITQFRICMEYV